MSLLNDSNSDLYSAGVSCHIFLVFEVATLQDLAGTVIIKPKVTNSYLWIQTCELATTAATSAAAIKPAITAPAILSAIEDDRVTSG
jgi:hypothetical protein